MKNQNNNTNWVRDEKSGALHNTNKLELDAYLEKHKLRKQIATQQDQINNLEKELFELKKMLCTII